MKVHVIRRTVGRFGQVEKVDNVRSAIATICHSHLCPGSADVSQRGRAKGHAGDTMCEWRWRASSSTPGCQSGLHSGE